MMKIKGAKPIKVGNSYCFTIPKDYINNGEIEVDKVYDVEILGPGVDLSPETIKEVTEVQVQNATKKAVQ